MKTFENRINQARSRRRDIELLQELSGSEGWAVLKKYLYEQISKENSRASYLVGMGDYKSAIRSSCIAQSMKAIVDFPQSIVNRDLSLMQKATDKAIEIFSRNEMSNFTEGDDDASRNSSVSSRFSKP